MSTTTKHIDPRDLPGLKKADITPCIGCNKGVLHNQNIVCTRLRVAQMVADLRAITQERGLELMLGNPGLASIMGPNQDMLKEMPQAHDVLICQDCSLRMTVAEVEEAANQRRRQAEAKPE